MKRKDTTRYAASDEENAATARFAKPKRELSPEEKRERTMTRALRLLTVRPRAVEELRQRLLEKDWTDAETVAAVIAKLHEYGYLDDDKFAQDYAAYQIRQKPTGRRRLQHELLRQRVAPETVETTLDAVFDETSEETLLDEALAKRLRVKGAPQTPAETQNLAAYLLRRGFRASLVWEKVRTEMMSDEC